MQFFPIQEYNPTIKSRKIFHRHRFRFLLETCYNTWFLTLLEGKNGCTQAFAGRSLFGTRSSQPKSCRPSRFAWRYISRVNGETNVPGLKRSEVDWRTLDGLQQSTSLPRDVILEWLQRHPVIIEHMLTPDHGVVFRAKDPRRSANEKFYLWIDKVLDYVSFGKRSQRA